MKDNVDLTLDRVFTTKTASGPITFEEMIIVNILGKKMLPWHIKSKINSGEVAVQITDDFSSRDSEFFRTLPPLVITGNSEERKKSSRNSSSKKNDYYYYCSYCGKKLLSLPWGNRPKCSCKKFLDESKVLPWNKVRN